MLTLLPAAIVDPKAATLMQEFLKVRLVDPIIQHLDIDHPELRAGLLASQLLGFGIGRSLLGFHELATLSQREATVLLGVNLQRLCSDPVIADGHTSSDLEQLKKEM